MQQSLGRIFFAPYKKEASIGRKVKQEEGLEHDERQIVTRDSSKAAGAATGRVGKISGMSAKANIKEKKKQDIRNKVLLQHNNIK